HHQESHSFPTRRSSDLQGAEAFDPQFGRKTFEVGVLRRAQYLDTFLGEITEEPTQGETRAVDRGLANFAVKPNARAFQSQRQFRSEEHTSELQSPCNLV